MKTFKKLSIDEIFGEKNWERNNSKLLDDLDKHYDKKKRSYW